MDLLGVLERVFQKMNKETAIEMISRKKGGNWKYQKRKTPKKQN